jgi:hypothetical protein
MLATMIMPSPEEKAARISVKGAWGIAVATVLGSLVISVITGFIAGRQTAINTASEIKATSVQSQTEYLRQQRQEIYGRYLSDLTIDEQCLFDLDVMIDGEKSTPIGRFNLTPINKALTNCADLGDGLANEFGALSLVSPSSISKQAQDIWASLRESYTSLSVYVQDVINHSASSASDEGAWGRDFDPVDGMITKITEVMKSVTYG